MQLPVPSPTKAYRTIEVEAFLYHTNYLLSCCINNLLAFFGNSAPAQRQNLLPVPVINHSVSGLGQLSGFLRALDHPHPF